MLGRVLRWLCFWYVILRGISCKFVVCSRLLLFRLIWLRLLPFSKILFNLSLFWLRPLFFNFICLVLLASRKLWLFNNMLVFLRWLRSLGLFKIFFWIFQFLLRYKISDWITIWLFNLSDLYAVLITSLKFRRDSHKWRRRFLFLIIILWWLLRVRIATTFANVVSVNWFRRIKAVSSLRILVTEF